MADSSDKLWTALSSPRRFTLIAGPCVIENEKICVKVAESLQKTCERLGITYVFKASYDKANRTSRKSFRGPGLDAGLETLAGPDVLRQFCVEYGPERVAFSLDMRDGEPFGNMSAWRPGAADHIAAEAVEAGVRRMILLDLARVGTGGGTGTEELLTRLSRTYPAVAWIVGGGVREAADLRRLKQAGASAVLVASALHDGRLRREHLDV